MLKISAQVKSRKGFQEVNLETNDSAHSIAIAPGSTGFGSSVNGGELLFLALATCYCNDIYREAKKRGIKSTSSTKPLSSTGTRLPINSLLNYSLQKYSYRK